MSLDSATADYLLRLARRALRAGAGAAAPPGPELAACPPGALAPGACFVTLMTLDGELRGCRGMLEPRRALAEDVWHNAWASAYDDPRFSPVTATELVRVRLEISVLGSLQPVVARDEADLRRQLVPHRDGVVLAWRGRRATFLPQVWEDLPEAADFLGHLKLKAGLSRTFWAEDVSIHRYAVEKLRETGPVPV